MPPYTTIVPSTSFLPSLPSLSSSLRPSLGNKSPCSLSVAGELLTYSPGTNRHEWKIAHGYRKFYKSRAEQIMRPTNVEITMGHDIGISSSHYKPTEREVIEDYLRAADNLTVNLQPSNLRKQIEDLTSKTRTDEYVIKTKLQEKDDALTILSDQVMKLMEEVKILRRKVAEVNDTLRSRNHRERL